MKKEKICGIYLITTPSGGVYVGQSTNCNYRMYRYKIADCKRQQRLYNSIVKHGWEKHTFEILLQCKAEELNFWEDFYINLFDSFDSDHGLNLREAGSNGSPSKETRKRNSISLKLAYSNGVKERPTGEKNGMYGNGHKLAGEKNGRYGKPVSEETREKIRQTQLSYNAKLREGGGKTLSEEHKKKISEAHKKLVKPKRGKEKAETILKRAEGIRKYWKEKGKRYFGVHMVQRKYDVVWAAYLPLNNKRKYIGTYPTETEAAIAYNEAVLKYKPDTGILNIIETEMAA